MKILKWSVRIVVVLLGLLFFLLIAGFVYERVARHVVRNEFKPGGRLISINGHSMHIEESGTGGPLVVFESGLDPGGDLVWGEVQHDVSRFTSTLSYDRSGIMWSDRGNTTKTADVMAGELYSLLKASSHKGPYILVAHSLGGYITRCFVAKHPEEVAGVVLVDASHPDQFKKMPQAALALDELPPVWLIKLASATGIVRLFLKDTYSNTVKTDSINILTNAYRSTSLAAMLEEYQQVDQSAAEAGRVTTFGNIPLIVITGSGKQRINQFPTRVMGVQVYKLWMQLQADQVGLSSKGEQVFATKSGHYIQLEQPDIVVSAIRNLVANSNSMVK